jgi:outer membrane protein OmpA-like peptidoglycan-associated protein/tetratricopeptide (TPR) repeat protein
MILTGTCVFAQLKKADRLFDRWAYYDAARIYKKEADKKSTPEINYKLGLCYQKMLKYEDAKAAYDKVNASGRYSDPMFYYNYGQVLKNTENYEEAIQAFNTYAQMNPDDPRADFYASSCQVIIDERGTDLPIPVKSVSTVNDEYASFSPVPYKDGILFTSSKNNGTHNKEYAWNNEPYYDLYYAPRASNLSEFKKETQFDNVINTKYSDGPASFTKNYDTLYFNRIGRELKGADKRNIGVETNKIFYASLKDGDWKDVTPFPYNSKEYSVASPYITKDGSRIYFASDMPGGYGEADLYYCNRQGNGWSAPVNLGPAINTFGNEKFPSLDSAGNLYFASDGYKGYGSMDIIVAKNNGGGMFEPGKVLKAPLNSAGDDYGITFVEDGHSGYISSVRKESKGDADIFSFSIDSLPCVGDVSNYVIGFRCPQEPQVAQIPDTLDQLAFEDLNLNPIIDLRIYFDFDKSNLRPESRRILDSLANYMKNDPTLETEINGHCDSRGSDAYNMALGLRRAMAAKHYLLSHGINARRLKTHSYGERQLTNNCSDGVDCTEDQHQENRRVEFGFNQQIRRDTYSHTPPGNNK